MWRSQASDSNYFESFGFYGKIHKFNDIFSSVVVRWKINGRKKE